MVGVLRVDDGEADPRIPGEVPPLPTPAVVENRTVSPSLSIQTTDVCGLPSSLRVATAAKFFPSSSARVSSSSSMSVIVPVWES